MVSRPQRASGGLKGHGCKPRQPEQPVAVWSLPLDRFPPSASSEPLQKTKAAVKGWISILVLASSLMNQRQQCLKRSKEIHCCNFFCIMDTQG